VRVVDAHSNGSDPVILEAGTLHAEVDMESHAS